MSWKLMEGEGAMERRIRVVGLCLAAVFALGAMVAVTSAQATVEIGQCNKVPKDGNKGKNKYKGRYKDKICSKANEATPEEEGLGGETNKYEWKPGAAGNGTFSGKGKEAKITAGELKVVCKTSVSTSAVRGGTGTGTIETKFLFRDCKQPENEKKACTTKGKTAGEIETKELIGTLGESISKEPVISYVHKEKGVIGNPTETWMEFECIEKTFTVTGTLAGKDTQTPNGMTKKGGMAFSSTVGSQELVAEFPPSFGGGPNEEEPLKLEFEQSNKFENSYELRQQ